MRCREPNLLCQPNARSSYRYAKARVEQHDFKGRVEHLVSREATHFDSLEELIAFIVQTLTEQPQ